MATPEKTWQPRSERVPLFTGLGYQVLFSEPPGALGADAPTLLLLHGFLDVSWGWAPLCRAGLADRFRIVAPDLRGHGDSDRVGAGGYYHFFDYVADVEALAVALDLRDVIVVGHSMGGMVAGYFTGSHPERVTKLALLEGTGPPAGEPTGPARVNRWIRAWQGARQRAGKGYETARDAARRLMAHDCRLSDEMALELATRGTRRHDDGLLRFKHDPLHLTAGPYGFDPAVAARFWERIECPVLLVEGGESPFRHAPDERDRRHRALRDRELVVVPGAAHMLQRHQPEALAHLLIGFAD